MGQSNINQIYNDVISNQVNLTEGLLAVDIDGNILSKNSIAEYLLDIKSHPNRQNFITDFHFFQIDDNLKIKESVNPIIHYLKEGLELLELTIGLKLEKDNYRWLGFTSKWIEFNNTKLILIALFDSTKLMKNHVALAQKQEQLQLLVSSLNDIVFEISDEGNFLNFWTNNSNHLFFQPKDFLNKNIKELFPIHISDKALELIHKAISEQDIQSMEFKSPVPSHHNKWYQVLIKPIFQTKNKVALIISDITTKKELDETTQIRDNAFINAFHFSGIGSALTDINGYAIDCNQTLTEILGYSREDLQKMISFDYTHPDDVQLDVNLRQKLLKNEKISGTIEKRYWHRDGYYLWCSATISLIKDKYDEAVCYIVQIQDISEAKKNNEILNAQKNELENTKNALEVKVNQLEEFNQIIAHNLRGPISNIQMLINELTTSQKDNDQYLQLLKKSSQNLTDTLNELSRVLELQSSEKADLELCRFSDITQKILEQFGIEIQKKNAIITTHYDVQEIKYSKVYLESILYNLISNSLKYSTKPPIIHIETFLKENKIILKIIDNGIGIDLERYKDDLFKFKKIFHRGYDSNGIGLFLIRHQIESLGGSIDIESTPGEGTTFCITF